MNTHTFDNHSVTCPICQRNTSLKLVNICSGLFICPSCRERLVVTWSGHYVRDPFNYKQIAKTGVSKACAHLIRRQSRPWARIVRDFGSIVRPAAIAVVGSAILIGVGIFNLYSLNSQQKPHQQLLEQVRESKDLP